MAHIFLDEFDIEPRVPGPLGRRFQVTRSSIHGGNREAALRQLDTVATHAAA